MSGKSDYLENKIIDHIFRARSFTAPTQVWVALIRATAGISPRSTAVTVGQTTVPATGNGRMYRCSTAGTTGASEPTWGTVDNGTTTDGTAVWTDMTSDFDSNSANLTGAEVTGGSYARATPGANSDTAWAATQGGTPAAASSGTGGLTSNPAALTFPAPSASWGVVAALALYDAATVGNQLSHVNLTTPKTINNGDPAPSFAIGALTITEG
jgi:hypothetical protein